MLNRSEIMNEAHGAARRAMASRMFPGAAYAEVFAMMLRGAWQEARRAAKMALRSVEQARIDALRQEAEIINMADCLNLSDRTRLGEISAEMTRLAA